jgi:hypothetical protein
MISKSYIQKNLKHFDSRFRRATSPKESLFYSKLALMELCGWIEMSMDDIVLRCAKRRIKDGNNTKMVADVIIKKNYGFDYQRNFRRMLISLVGLAGVERLEKKLNPPIHTLFVSTLQTLRTARNAEAHTYVKGTTRAIDAPSVTLSRFQPIYLGLRALDTRLQKLGY